MKHLLILALLFQLQLCFSQEVYKDAYFMQEYHEAYPVGFANEDRNVRSIAVDNSLNVWIATAKGVFKKSADDTLWLPMLPAADNGPAYAVETDGNAVWMGTWNSVFVCANNHLTKLPGTEGPVSSICIAKEGVYAAGPKGVWLSKDGDFSKKNYSIPRSVRSVVSDSNNGLWIATDVGLYHCNNKQTKRFCETSVLLSAALKGLAFDDKSALWVAGLGGISILQGGRQLKTLQPQNGIPSVYVNCLKRSRDNQMWVGTNTGVVRFAQDGSSTLRFTRRWLMDDHVNDIAFDSAGNAWIATANGVSAIKKRRMNLHEKADYFYDVLMKRHIRDPWIAGQCHLSVPGDITSWFPEDDDNDGEYTSNYLAMECFRYATTRDNDAKQKAKKAFDFLRELQTITGSNGFFARTMVPIEWRERVYDNNRNYSAQELAEELVNDPRFKPVEKRWHLSANGKWLWKGDASSDEMCGHMMGYYFYYELVADAAEKDTVLKHVASIVDHLIANDFNMLDVDSMHTHWAVWSPKLLNHDPEWSPDQNENSMELLAFLKLAFYMTKENKYQQLYLHLIRDEHYLDNMDKIMDQNPAWFIYFDVILQAYLYPILLKCETDPQLLAFYQKHMDKYFALRKNDNNPLINFFYCYSRDKKSALAASIDFLKDTPLDLVDWTVDHTKREDVKIVRTPVLDEVQVKELPPASIRPVVRWDKNPWAAINGTPNIEREPVFWLLPYWMGRYLKMIE